MSLRYEQYSSLLATRQFLYDLLLHTTRPKTIKELKQRASRCLRHYPSLTESGRPLFSQDDITKD